MDDAPEDLVDARVLDHVGVNQVVPENFTSDDPEGTLGGVDRHEQLCDVDLQRPLSRRKDWWSWNWLMPDSLITCLGSG